jgi:hypothetical protein
VLRRSAGLSLWALSGSVPRSSFAPLGLAASKRVPTKLSGLHSFYWLLFVGTLDFSNITNISIAVLTHLGINAFVYMTIARLVYFVLPNRQVWNVKATWLTKLFVWLDVLSFIVQLAGGATLSQDGGEIVRIGQTVYMVGVGIQGLFILVFGAMTWTLYAKLLCLGREDRDITRVKRLVWTMYAVLVLIMVSLHFPKKDPFAVSWRSPINLSGG